MKTKREEEFYELAGREVAENRLVPAVWSKAFSEALGDQQAALALYIRFRVEQLERGYQQEQVPIARLKNLQEQITFLCILLFIIVVVIVTAILSNK